MQLNKQTIYAEACKEWRNQSSRVGASSAQLRGNIVAVASRWRRCIRSDQPVNRTQAFGTNSDVH